MRECERVRMYVCVHSVNKRACYTRRHSFGILHFERLKNRTTNNKRNRTFHTATDNMAKALEFYVVLYWFIWLTFAFTTCLCQCALFIWHSYIAVHGDMQKRLTFGIQCIFHTNKHYNVQTNRFFRSVVHQEIHSNSNDNNKRSNDLWCIDWITLNRTYYSATKYDERRESKEKVMFESGSRDGNAYFAMCMMCDKSLRCLNRSIVILFPRFDKIVWILRHTTICIHYKHDKLPKYE